MKLRFATDEWHTLEYIENITNQIREYYGDIIAERFLKMLSRAENISGGRNRITLLMGKYVVKFPISPGGYGDNDWEGSICGGEYIQYARTRLHYYHDTPIVFMEQVSPVKSFNGLPDWCDFVDCCQVGYTRAGKLVAYDFGIN